MLILVSTLGQTCLGSLISCNLIQTLLDCVGPGEVSCFLLHLADCSIPFSL